MAPLKCNGNQLVIGPVLTLLSLLLLHPAWLWTSFEFVLIQLQRQLASPLTSLDSSESDVTQWQLASLRASLDSSESAATATCLSSDKFAWLLDYSKFACLRTSLDSSESAKTAWLPRSRGQCAYL